MEAGSQPGGGSAAAEPGLAGDVFRDVACEFLAPDRLPGAAGTVHGLFPGEIGMGTAKIAPTDASSRHPGVGFSLFSGAHGNDVVSPAPWFGVVKCCRSQAAVGSALRVWAGRMTGCLRFKMRFSRKPPRAFCRDPPLFLFTFLTFRRQAKSQSKSSRSSFRSRMCAVTFSMKSAWRTP